MALGTYSTTPKSHQRKSINRTHFRYLNKVHVDIDFRETVAVGGAHYVLVSVDRATCYNWVFALKSLVKEEIKASLASSALRQDDLPSVFGVTVTPSCLPPSSNVTSPPRGRTSCTPPRAASPPMG